MERAMSDTTPTLTERQRFWLEHLTACGNRSLKAYAEEHALNISLLYEAKSRLKRKGLLGALATSPRFARVQREPAPGTPSLCRIRLPNGTAVELACEPEHWPALLASVAALP
jgi:hypothetical protein